MNKASIRSSLFLVILVCFLMVLPIIVIASSEFAVAPDSSTNQVQNRNAYQHRNLKVSDTIKINIPENKTFSNITATSAEVNANNRVQKVIELEKVKQEMNTISVESTIEDINAYTVSVDFSQFRLHNAENNRYRTYSIDWGNGDTIQGTEIPTSTVSYTYADQGEYTVSISMEDEEDIVYTVESPQTFALSSIQVVQLWTNNHKESLALGTISISSIMLLGFAATESGRYKILAFFAVLFPMVTKAEQEDVLDHFVRGQIYGYIKANPGAHYQQIKRVLGVKNGTLSHHLYVLEKTGLLKSRMEKGIYRAFYTTEMRFPDQERFRLTELQLAILKVVRNREPISQKEIAKTLQQKHQTVNYNVKVLRQAGLLSMHKVGRKTMCMVQRP